jgi:hypothetical protein
MPSFGTFANDDIFGKAIAWKATLLMGDKIVDNDRYSGVRLQG